MGLERYYCAVSASECGPQLQFFCPTSTPLFFSSLCGRRLMQRLTHRASFQSDQLSYSEDGSEKIIASDYVFKSMA